MTGMFHTCRITITANGTVWKNRINTFAPHGVLVLRSLSHQLSSRSTGTPQFSKTCKKKSIVAIGFRFVPLDSPMFVVSVTASRVSAYAGLS